MGSFFLYKTKTTATVRTLKSSPDWHSYPKDSEGIQGWKQVLRSDRSTLSWEDNQQKKCFPLAKKHQYWIFKPNFKMHATPHGSFSVGGEDKMLCKHTSVCVCERVCVRWGWGGGGGVRDLKPDQSCRVVVCSIRSFEIPTDLASNKTRSTTLNVPTGALYCWMQ